MGVRDLGKTTPHQKLALSWKRPQCPSGRMGFCFCHSTVSGSEQLLHTVHEQTYVSVHEGGCSVVLVCWSVTEGDTGGWSHDPGPSWQLWKDLGCWLWARVSLVWRHARGRWAHVHGALVSPWCGSYFNLKLTGTTETCQDLDAPMRTPRSV